MQTLPTPATLSLEDIARQVRESARQLATLPALEKNRAIEAVAASLETSAAEILRANREDCEAAIADNISKPLYNRLKLDEAKLAGAIVGVRNVGTLPDPVGTVQIRRELDTGLVLERVACPVGVLGTIFEARPDAVVQIASLALKSGNGVLLKGGKEALRSCRAIAAAIRRGLEKSAVDPAAVRLLTTREETIAMLKLENYIDLIVPRGSNAFVRFVQDNTRIPVLGHADGICHIYADKAADPAKSLPILIDAKTGYPAACNAVETLLVHRDIAPQFLPAVAAELGARQVELRGDAIARQIEPSFAPASEADWETEYTDLILSVKVVDSLEAAISHINQYGSRHTDAILTEDPQAAAIFLDRVDAAGVFHNCSTRFSDGFRYGFGAEVGISTQKMPPRGPVGLEGLVTYKYRLVGDGHVVATYSGKDAKPFTHRDIDI